MSENYVLERQPSGHAPNAYCGCYHPQEKMQDSQIGQGLHPCPHRGTKVQPFRTNPRSNQEMRLLRLRLAMTQNKARHCEERKRRSNLLMLPVDVIHGWQASTGENSGMIIRRIHRTIPEEQMQNSRPQGRLPKIQFSRRF